MDKLLIRGDRLLVLVTALRTLVAYAFPGDFSPRILGVNEKPLLWDALRKATGLHKEAFRDVLGLRCARVTLERHFYSLKRSIDLLKANPLIANQEITVPFGWLLEDLVDYRLMPFYQLFASGEITEEMLKEPEAANA